MKRKIIGSLTLAILILTLCLTSLAGCDKSLKAGEIYYLYAYSVKEDRFVKVGSSIVFGKDFKTYSCRFIDGTMLVRGAAEHNTKPNYYSLTCSEDVIPVLVQKYRDYLISSGASEETMSYFNTLSDKFSPDMQLFDYGSYLFEASSAELAHSVVSGEKSDSFEGEFVMTATGDTLKFKGGTAYSKDDGNEYTIRAGYYTVSNGFMTFTTLDDKGNDKIVDGVLYRKRYLMAKVTFPDNFEFVGTDLEGQEQDVDWLKTINAQLSAYSGKTVSVLCSQFYSTEMK